MSYMDYSNAQSVKKSGQRAFLMGIKREDSPVDRRTHANSAIHWGNGWLRQSKIKCKGIELGCRNFSGCTQTDGDCPVCGK